VHQLAQEGVQGSGFRVAASACAPQGSGWRHPLALPRVKLLAPEGVQDTADADGASVSAADKSSNHQVIKSSSLLRLLPALPKAWPSGKVTGLCARGGFEVDMSWADGCLTKAVIRSKSGLPCKVVCGDKTWDLNTKAGKSYPLTLASAVEPRKSQ